MTSKKHTPEELSNLLVEKHQEFIAGYKKEFDILDRIFVLKEKQDQLEYWLHDSKDDLEKNQKYLKIMRAADKELLKLNEELAALYGSNPDESPGGPPNVSKTPAKSEHKLLKSKIETHNEALDYWNGKIQELLKAKKDKKAREKEEMAGKAEVPK